MSKRTKLPPPYKIVENGVQLSSLELLKRIERQLPFHCLGSYFQWIASPCLPGEGHLWDFFEQDPELKQLADTIELITIHLIEENKK